MEFLTIKVPANVIDPSTGERRKARDAIYKSFNWEGLDPRIKRPSLVHTFICTPVQYAKLVEIISPFYRSIFKWIFNVEAFHGKKSVSTYYVHDVRYNVPFKKRSLYKPKRKPL